MGREVWWSSLASGMPVCAGVAGLGGVRLMAAAMPAREVRGGDVAAARQPVSALPRVMYWPPVVVGAADVRVDGVRLAGGGCVP